MRKFKFQEQDEDHETMVTEDWILEVYWPYWCGQMVKVGKAHELLDAKKAREDCIQDFITVNWAEEVK